MLTALARRGPYFTVGTGTPPDGPWLPTATLREDTVRDRLVADLADRMHTTESRVAASTLFFGYAARLWSVALGSVAESGRCPALDPERLLWLDDAGLRLHVVEPRFASTGDDRALRGEVLDSQLEPLVTAWAGVVAPGLLWGNTASALVATGRLLGPGTDRLVDTLLRDRRLRGALDAASRRRRSCCLYYRVPGGGLCGDCSFTTPPGGATPPHVTR